MKIKNKRGRLSPEEQQAIEEELDDELDESDYELENYRASDFQIQDDDSIDDFSDFVDDWH